MKIKTLNWKKRTVAGEKAWWLESDLMLYSIEPMNGALMAWHDDEQLEAFDREEDAKAYCQKHFEKQVQKFLVQS